MSTEFWKIEKDLCRCCHSEGSHKNLAEPCLEGGEEIYSEMLHDTLDINISPVSGDLGTVTYTICEVCIMRLQDAWSFKQQVLQCENRFNDLYTKNVIKLEPDCVVVSIKEEADSDNEGFKEEKLDDSDGDFEMSFGDGNNSDSDMDTKPKSKAKPKAKSKTTPKAPPKKKPATKTATKTSTTSESAEGQAEPKEKKDAPLCEAESNYSTVKVGVWTKWRCNICYHVTKYVRDIQKHIRTEHSSENELGCSLCQAKFVKEKCKRQHLAKLHNAVEKRVSGSVMIKRVRSKVCRVCKLKFETLLELKQHKCTKKLQNQTQVQEQGNCCPICFKEFANKTQLKSHKRRHTSRKCRYCLQQIAFPDLQRHMKEEHSDKLPTCAICGIKSLSKSAGSAHHRKVHLKEKNVPCPQCDMKFFDRAMLLKHMVRHDPVKRFECKSCKKCFARENTLRTHEKIHTGDKNIICYVCGERFVQKASLNYHMTKRHPGMKIHFVHYVKETEKDNADSRHTAAAGPSHE